MSISELLLADVVQCSHTISGACIILVLASDCRPESVGLVPEALVPHHVDDVDEIDEYSFAPSMFSTIL